MKAYHLLTVLFSIALIMFVSSCGGTEEGNAGGENEFDTHGQAGVVDDVSKKNILQIAISSPDHTTLVAGVQAAELENVLVNPGPLTVFAPNNAAFDKLPEGTLDELLKPENKNTLGKIITSHAAPGTFTGKLLKDGSKIYLATGQYVDVVVKDGDTYVNGSKLLGTVDASNGVVHVIDDVWVF
jgi:uncharacterized surface protein with fasciclin (FAS1) repeats